VDLARVSPEETLMPDLVAWVTRAAGSSAPMCALADAFAKGHRPSPSDALEVNAGDAAQAYRAQIAQLRQFGFALDGDASILAAFDRLAPTTRIWRAQVKVGTRVFFALFDLGGAPLGCMTFDQDPATAAAAFRALMGRDPPKK
jgi:hypothetical protein